MNGNSVLATRPRANGVEVATLRAPLVLPTEELGRLAAELEQRGEALCVLLLDRYRLRVDPDAELSDPFWTALSGSIRQGLLTQLADLRRGALPAERPAFALDAVRAVLAIDRLDLLLSAYRISHEVLWEAWFDLLEHSPLPPAARRPLLQFGSHFLFRYEALLSDCAAEDYHRSLEQGPGGNEQRRFRGVTELLDGETPSQPSLDFDLERHHLGLIAWGAEADRTVHCIAETLQRPLLSVSPLDRDQSVWAWISGTRPLDSSEQQRLRAFQPAGGGLALGLEGFGLAGFRASHRQALRARRLAGGGECQVVHYDDVILEALAIENEDEARAFVAHELCGIEDDSQSSCRLRQTLEAYFTAEYNAASAGAALGVHQQTVANRLRAAEQRLGQPSIRARRVELEMALRLRSALTHAES